MHQIAGITLGIDSISRVDLEAYQLLRLRQTIQYAYDKSSFYREMFDKAGVVPDDLQSFSDLSGIPFTEPRHLSEAPYRFLCISQAEIARPFSFVTSGTTGPQKKVFLSHGDLEKIIEFMAAGIATVANQEDVVQILLADGRPYSQADLLYRGVRGMGATPVISGMDIGAEEQLRILEKSHSTILFGYTGQIFRLSKELQHKTDLNKTGVKVLFLAGEYLPEAMRQELQQIWNCRVHTHYGLTEMGLGVAVECNAHAGYHFNEAGLYLEVINPRTGEVVPPGEEGELVFTTLAREAMPLVRYRTHDISRLIPGPCPDRRRNPGSSGFHPLRRRSQNLVGDMRRIASIATTRTARAFGRSSENTTASPATAPSQALRVSDRYRGARSRNPTAQSQERFRTPRLAP